MEDRPLIDNSHLEERQQVRSIVSRKMSRMHYTLMICMCLGVIASRQALPDDYVHLLEKKAFASFRTRPVMIEGNPKII